MKTHAKTGQGFTFVEILFAMVCLGILLVPVFRMLGQGSAGVVRNRNEILAQQHASNIMSYAYFLPYDHEFLKVSASRELTALETNLGGTSVDLGVNEPGFRRTLQVSEVKPTAWKHAYKIVTVVVRWQERSGLNRHIKLAGLVAK